MQRLFVPMCALVLGLSAAAPVQACGEGVFNMGQGLRYQGYLAPRPATVLVYDEAGAAHHELYAGLQKAGHHVTVVGDAAHLSRALAAQRYDVVISSLADIDAVAGNGAGPNPQSHLLPVVERSQRNAPALRRFSAFVLDDASLGQYLKTISQLLSARGR